MSAATDVHSRAQTMLAQAESQRVLKAPLGDLPCLRQATTAKSGKPGSGTGSWSGGVSGNHRRSGQRACREPGMQADTLAASDQAALAAAGLSDVRLRFPPPLVFYAADDTPPSCLDKVGCVCSVCVCVRGDTLRLMRRMLGVLAIRCGVCTTLLGVPVPERNRWLSKL